MSDNQNQNDGYEDVCYICRRPESVAGRMIRIPNNICICQDCMQKTFDSMSSYGFPPVNFMPGNNGSASVKENPDTDAGEERLPFEEEGDENLNNVEQPNGFPTISLMGLNDLMGKRPTGRMM